MKSKGTNPVSARRVGESPRNFRIEALEELLAQRSGDRVEGRNLILYGVGEGADAIAREYYQTFALEEPLAVILVFPKVGPLELNNLTCPFLVIQHAEQDNARGLENAVLHHQMRYGDPTDRLIVADPDHLDGEALSLINGWLTMVEKSRRALPPGSSDVGSVA